MCKQVPNPPPCAPTLTHEHNSLQPQACSCPMSRSMSQLWGALRPQTHRRSQWETSGSGSNSRTCCRRRVGPSPPLSFCPSAPPSVPLLLGPAWPGSGAPRTHSHAPRPPAPGAGRASPGGLAGNVHGAGARRPHLGALQLPAVSKEASRPTTPPAAASDRVASLMNSGWAGRLRTRLLPPAPSQRALPAAGTIISGANRWDRPGPGGAGQGPLPSQADRWGLMEIHCLGSSPSCT